MTDFLKTKASKQPAAVLGAGTLGSRIALMLATRGGEVRIFDRQEEATRKALAFVEKHLPEVAPSIEGGTPGHVKAASTLEKAVDGAWLVIEALPEKLELKTDIFGQLDQLTAEDVILATNSSSFPSSQIVGKVKHRNRVLNTHFMMPPEKRVVELMSCGSTDQGLIEDLARYFKEVGLSPYVAQKESVGFIENRIWAAIKRESLCVAAEGVSDPETIDRIYCETQGTPAGPFRLMDQVGLDIVLQIEEHYAQVFPELPEAPRTLLRKMIAENRLGVKTGRGFYTYDEKKS
ncbi:3-hydroxyacyl-CoA dehydrogenase family protein [Bombella sp. TMW 2.2559]|uniref:3-hydroxyacyl-CoA dehydrogenase family protein n=1 Tax=Bombella dulcis TaxID=2967339 RepID=A0ABT3WAI4_9PROT|nr:3-hydroxyacyl-CoA dehydrogenase family protein [Bombella dulcis]MCX5616090.1 3-hydroxyacyl-CoA dehydrogenase family protein [Bombella dulcis]